MRAHHASSSAVVVNRSARVVSSLARSGLAASWSSAMLEAPAASTRQNAAARSSAMAKSPSNNPRRMRSASSVISCGPAGDGARDDRVDGAAAPRCRAGTAERRPRDPGGSSRGPGRCATAPPAGCALPSAPTARRARRSRARRCSRPADRRRPDRHCSWPASSSACAVCVRGAHHRGRVLPARERLELVPAEERGPVEVVGHRSRLTEPRTRAFQKVTPSGSTPASPTDRARPSRDTRSGHLDAVGLDRRRHLIERLMGQDRRASARRAPGPRPGRPSPRAPARVDHQILEPRRVGEPRHVRPGRRIRGTAPPARARCATCRAPRRCDGRER